MAKTVQQRKRVQRRYLESREFLTGIVYYHQEDKGPTSVGKVIEAEDVTVGFPVYEYESTCSSHEEQWGIDIDNSIMFWGAVKEIFY